MPVHRHYRLLPATDHDQAFLEALFRELKTPEFAPLGLPPAALEPLLAMQFQAQRRGYAAQYPYALDRVVWVEKERAGRVLVDRGADGMQLVDFALRERFRGEGLGTALLRLVCEEADAAELSLGLTVRFDNPAERLYTRAGFLRTGGDGLHVRMERTVAATRSPGEQARAGHSMAAARQQEEGTVEPDTTSHYFRTQVGNTFPAYSLEADTPEKTVPLTLRSVMPLPRPRSSSVDLDEEESDSFILSFTGPAKPVLPNAMTQWRLSDEVQLEIFLGPVEAIPDGIRYEAIFNRSR